jgi:hypothetical protein
VKTLSAGFERQVRDYVAAIWIKLGELEGKTDGGASSLIRHFQHIGLLDGLMAVEDIALGHDVMPGRSRLRSWQARMIASL